MLLFSIHFPLSVPHLPLFTMGNYSSSIDEGKAFSPLSAPRVSFAVVVECMSAMSLFHPLLSASSAVHCHKVANSIICITSGSLNVMTPTPLLSVRLFNHIRISSVD